MATKVASLYAEIGSDTTKLEAGIKKSKSLLTSLKGSTDKMVQPLNDAGSILMNLGKMAAPAIAAGYALKKAFDWGAEGTQLEYAADKFDRLTASIGGTSDALLVDLRKATKGTLSDAKLMAGAGDLMALGLANSYDEVVRLSKVVGGLGMDMNQLVLTLTNQTTMRFDALGVSVDGFDAKVAKLKATGMSANDAFKEAFLQQAEEQLAKVGDKADTGAGSIARMEASVENLANSLKMKLAPAAVTFADVMTRNIEITRILNEAEDAGLITSLERTRAGSFLFGSEEANMKQVEEIAKKLEGYNKMLADAAMRSRSAGRSTDEHRAAVTTLDATLQSANRDLAEQKAAFDGVISPAQAAENKIRAVSAAEAEAYRNARNWKSGLGETVSLLDRLNTMDLNFGDKIKAELDQMAWDAAGGDVIQQAGGRINKALEAGKITPAQAEEMLKELAIASDTLAANINKTDFNTLAQALVDDLHIPLDEAKTKAQEAIDAIKAGALEKYIYTIEIRYNDGGYHPAWEGKQTQGITVSPGDGSGRGNQGTPKASGGAVNIGTSYMVGERGPEMFTPGASGYITPNHALGGGDTYVTNNIYQLPGEDGASLAARVVAMQARANRRGAAGLGYAGA